MVTTNLAKRPHGSYEHTISLSIMRLATHYLEAPENNPISQTCYLDAVKEATRALMTEALNDPSMMEMSKDKNAAEFIAHSFNYACSNMLFTCEAE